MKKTAHTMREARRRRIRARIIGTAARPRLCVFRSNRYLAVQIIDDTAGKTIVAGTTAEKKSGKKNVAAKRVELAALLGERIAKIAREQEIEKIVFDRGSYRYHGRVKAFADGARKGGLVF